MVYFFVIYGIQLFRQLFYLDDRHFQVKFFLYISFLYSYVESVNKLSVYDLSMIQSTDSSEQTAPYSETCLERPLPRDHLS